MTREQDYRDRFSELESDLWNAVIWASFLDKIVDDVERLPSMSEMEVNVSYGQLYRVTEALKESISRLDATYHNRRKEEDAVAAA
jgi:hypothetical protein